MRTFRDPETTGAEIETATIVGRCAGGWVWSYDRDDGDRGITAILAYATLADDHAIVGAKVEELEWEARRGTRDPSDVAAIARAVHDALVAAESDHLRCVSLVAISVSHAGIHAAGAGELWAAAMWGTGGMVSLVSPDAFVLRWGEEDDARSVICASGLGQTPLVIHETRVGELPDDLAGARIFIGPTEIMPPVERASPEIWPLPRLVAPYLALPLAPLSKEGT